MLSVTLLRVWRISLNTKEILDHINSEIAPLAAGEILIAGIVERFYPWFRGVGQWFLAESKG